MFFSSTYTGTIIKSYLELSVHIFMNISFYIQNSQQMKISVKIPVDYDIFS